MQNISSLRNLGVIALLLVVVAVQIITQQFFPLTETLHWHFPFQLPFTSAQIYLFNRIFQALAFLVFLGLIALMESREQIRPKLYAVLAGIALVGAFVAALTNLASPDCFYYIGHGRKLAILHLSPYTPLADVRTDEIIRMIPEKWLSLPSLYGPTAVIFFGFLNVISPPTMPALLLTFKLAWFGMFLLFSVFLYRMLKHYRYTYTRWFAFCANPVTWHLCLRDAHVEMMMVLFILFCLMAAIKRKWLACGIALGLLCTTKIIMLIIAPFFAIHILRDTLKTPQWRQRKHNLLLFLLGFLGYVIPAYAIFNGGELFGLLDFYSTHDTSFFFIPWIILKFSEATGIGYPVNDPVAFAHISSEIILLSGLCGMFIHACRARIPLNLAAASGIAMMFFIFTVTYQFAWYILWGIVFLIIAVPTLKEVFLLAAFYTLFGTFDNPY